jgi:hypothetical protein
LARCFHLHPLLIIPQVKQAMPTTPTIDGDYLTKACPNRKRVYVTQDTDDFAVFELSSITRTDYLPKRKGQVVPNRASVLNVAKWTVGATDSYHRYFSTIPIKLHHEPLDDQWSMPIQESNKVVASILRCHKLMIVVLPFLPFLTRAISWLRCRLRIRTRLRALLAWRRGLRPPMDANRQELENGVSTVSSLDIPN